MAVYYIAVTIRDPALKTEAIRLRSEERQSFTEILKKIPVAKSTLSLWLRDYPLTEEELRSRRGAERVYLRKYPVPRKRVRMSKSESSERNLLVLESYQKGFGCRTIADQLGLKNADVFRRLKRMGVLRTYREAADRAVPECPTVPYFSRIPSGENLNKAAVGVSVGWFLRKGYMVSLPVEPAHYDLVVESDEGLKKVQVKSTTSHDKGGAWKVYVSRTAYSSEVEIRGAAGKRRRTSYTKEQVDLFFVLTGDGSIFLIPVEALGSVKTINLDTKYAKYRADVVKLADTQP